MTVSLSSLQKLMSLNLSTEQMAGVIEVLTVELGKFSVVKKHNPEHAARKRIRQRRMGISWSKWRRIRKEVIARDGNKCRYCGEETSKIAVDHIVPLYQGGTTDLENLTVACTPCNSRKGGMTVEEWMGKCR